MENSYKGKNEGISGDRAQIETYTLILEHTLSFAHSQELYKVIFFVSEYSEEMCVCTHMGALAFFFQREQHQPWDI